MDCFNTFTFVKTLYEDFGILGVAFISTIWGALARYFIEKGFKNFSLLNLFIIAVFVLTFLMTFYESFFHCIIMFIYWSLVLVVISRYFKTKGIITYVKYA